MALHMHMAAIVLKLQGTMIQPIDRMGLSLIAGCTSSTSIARSHLRDTARTAQTNTEMEIGQHVDDICHNMHHRTRAGHES